MKKFVLFILVFFSINKLFSQSFMHGAGVNIFVTKAQNSSATVFAGFDYSPRVNFLEGESFSLSVGVPLSVGISGSYSYSSYDGYSSEDNSLGYMINIPLMVNINTGCGSTKENGSRFGFFAGAGFGYHNGNFKTTSTDEYGYDYTTQQSISAYGPAANIGFRIAVGSHQKNIETRLSYMKGIDESKANIFGVGVLFNF